MSQKPAERPLQQRIIHLLASQETRAKSHRLPVAVRLVIWLAVLIAIGTALLNLPGMTTRPLTFMETFFTAASAATVTGLSITNTSTDFTLLGQITLLILIQLGGVGFIVTVVLTLRLLGRRISLLDRMALTSSLGLDKPIAILQILWRTLIVILIAESLGAILLYIHWRSSGIVAGDQIWFYAIFHAITAFCNSGFDLFAGLPNYPRGIPGDSITLIILGTLVILGGLGIPVYLDVLNRKGRRRFTLHTRITLVVTVLLILVGWAGILLSEYRFGGLLSETAFGERIVRAWFQSVSARTAGFPGLADFANLRQDSRMLIMALMFIGSAPASMGGGITTGSFAVLGLSVWSYARGSNKVQVQHRTISPGSVQRAIAVLVISIALVGLASWALLLTHGFRIDTALFEVISAFSTCGLSLGITRSLNTFGQLVIILAMFWGRLGALTIMIALLQRKSPPGLVDYPEERVLVG